MCLHRGEDWVLPHCHKAMIGVVLQWCLFFCRFLLSPCMIMEVEYDQVLDHQSNQGPFSISCSVWPGGQLYEESWLFQTSFIKVNRDYMHPWMFNAAETVLYPSPDLCLDTILSWRSTDNSFDFLAWFVLWLAVLAVGTLYRQVFAFSNHAQSTKFTTGGLQLSGRNISRMIVGIRMHRSYILSVMAKAVNTFFIN